MVKGANTIEEYKILEWVEQNFIKGSIDVSFIENGNAIIEDGKGERMEIHYKDGKIEVKGGEN